MNPRYFARLAGLAVLALTAAVSAQEMKLSAVNFVPNNQAFGKPFVEFVEKVNRGGKGLVQIELRASGSMSPFTMGNAVKTGVVDIAHLPATFYQNLLPVGDALKMIEKTPAQMRANGAMDLINQLHMEKVNVVYLGHWGTNVPFHIYLRDRKVEKPDLSGLKLRITPVYRAFFKALGATVIQIPPAEVYIGLERGAVDGLGWPTWDIKSFGWDKHIKYRIDPPFYNTQEGILLNLDKWKAMTKAQQEYLVKQVRAFEDEMWVKAQELDRAYRKEQADAGIQVIEFKGKTGDEYRKLAYEEGWKEAMQLDPVNAPKLKRLIAK